jgi:hypothetical protein
MRVIRDCRASGTATTAVLLVAAIVLGAAGCGGDEESSPATAAESERAARPERSPLTRAELIAKADAVCVASRRALERAALKRYRDIYFPEPTKRLPWVPYAEDSLSIVKRTVRQLKTLTPPPALRDAYAAYTAAHEEIEGLAEQALQAAIADNDGIYYKARKTQDAGVLERAELAEAVGLKKCSPNPFFR